MTRFDSRWVARRCDRRSAQSACAALLAFGAACEETFDDAPGTGGASNGTTETVAATSSTGLGDDPGGTIVDVEVPASGRVYVDLEPAAVVGEADAWDLAFEGVDVFTHGGLSAAGEGAAFGPLPATQFLSDERPTVPFMIDDHAGGAFRNWYAYDGTTHALWSRYHVLGVRRESTTYKLQVLSYYGEIQGAPVSAVYTIRYAEVGPNGSGQTSVVSAIDGTAGGANPSASSASECLVLATGERILHTPESAGQDPHWDLCFRRDLIRVNGERGGPGGVVAVNLDANHLEAETIAEVQARTADGERARFDAVGATALSAPELAWRGDRIVTAFSDRWIELVDGALAPAWASWLVRGTDGREHLAVFESFTGATDERVGIVRLRTKAISQ